MEDLLKKSCVHVWFKILTVVTVLQTWRWRQQASSKRCFLPTIPYVDLTQNNIIRSACVCVCVFLLFCYIPFSSSYLQEKALLWKLVVAQLFTNSLPSMKLWGLLLCLQEPATGLFSRDKWNAHPHALSHLSNLAFILKNRRHIIWSPDK
jgi:hypothetical protein